MSAVSDKSLPAETAPRRLAGLHRRLLIISATGFVLFLIGFLFLLGYRSAESEKQGIVIGARSIVWELESSTSDKFFTRTSEKPDPEQGDFETNHEFGIRVPSGTFVIRVHHDPVPLIRKNLPTNIVALIKLLDSRDPAKVYCAAEALEEWSEEAISALPKLISAAERTGYFYPAMQRIAIAQPQLAVPPLIDGLSADCTTLRWQCAAVLGEIGTNAHSAAPALLAAFQAATNQQQVFAHALLSVTGDLSPTLPKLRTILKESTNSFEQIVVLQVLAAAGPQAAPALPEVTELAHLGEEQDRLSVIVRQWALHALSRISPDAETALPMILEALDAPLPYRAQFRSFAIRALGNFGSAGLPHLIPIYHGTNQQDCVNAAQALAQMGPAAADALDVFLADLDSEDASRVLYGCNIIEKMGERAAPAIPRLKNLLFVPNRRIRVHAAATLTTLGEYSENMVPILVEAIGENTGDEALAVSTLGQIVRTNSEAANIFKKRLSSNPRAEAYFRQNWDILGHFGFAESRPPGTEN